jgi:hypothetical protein
MFLCCAPIDEKVFIILFLVLVFKSLFLLGD